MWEIEDGTGETHSMSKPWGIAADPASAVDPWRNSTSDEILADIKRGIKALSRSPVFMETSIIPSSLYDFLTTGNRRRYRRGVRRDRLSIGPRHSRGWRRHLRKAK